MLVESLHGDLGEDMGCWTRINSTMTRKLVLPTLIISMLRATTHTRDKSRDLVMARTLDSHPKAVPWVLEKLF